MRIAANLFAAGQETTVRLLGAAFQFIGERPDLQKQLREDHDRILNFVEETLRIESPVKGDFRLSRVPTTMRSAPMRFASTVMASSGWPRSTATSGTTPSCPRRGARSTR